jgi:2-deoxy-D-gluconate 3-dehydrogenase
VPGVLDSFRLDGRVACVTGTTRGIGRAVATALAEAGCDVVHLDRSEPDATRAEVEAAGRRSAHVPLDLATADAASCEAAIDAARRAFGRLDILVNSAGVTARGPVLELPEEDVLRVLQVDLVAALGLSRAAGRVFVAQRSGVILNVASLLAFQGGINIFPYTTAKHGLLGLTRALANEWAPAGVRVNAIAPGYIATDLNAVLREDRRRNEELLDRIPVGRWGTPGDLAGTVVYLCSPASAYVTGECVVVDGGWMSR